MKPTLAPGILGRKQIIVEPHLAISFMGPEVPGVLASPHMLFLMEHAARESVLAHLDPGEDSVGVGFEFEHCAAAPIGATVTANTELLSVEGRKLRFRIEARDERETIGHGFHTRAVVNISKFVERLKQKMKG